MVGRDADQSLPLSARNPIESTRIRFRFRLATHDSQLTPQYFSSHGRRSQVQTPRLHGFGSWLLAGPPAFGATPSAGGEGPRGRGADIEKAVVFACRACGEKRRDLEGIRSDSTCVRCGADLHACRQCAHFDTSARFECTQPIPARIPDKNVRNACRFYAPAKSFDLAGSKALNTPEDARAAFDRLFKK